MSAKKRRNGALSPEEWGTIYASWRDELTEAVREAARIKATVEANNGHPDIDLLDAAAIATGLVGVDDAEAAKLVRKYLSPEALRVAIARFIQWNRELTAQVASSEDQVANMKVLDRITLLERGMHALIVVSNDPESDELRALVDEVSEEAEAPAPKVLIYGTPPARAAFDAAFDLAREAAEESGEDWSLSEDREEAWNVLSNQIDRLWSSGDQESGDAAAQALRTLGFEWV